jgi:hypothetical protein
MTSLAVLAGCIVVPATLCSTLKLWFFRGTSEPRARDRLLERFRRVTLGIGTVLLIGAALAGALATDSTLLPRWPTFAAWFFSSLCVITVWVTMALCQRTPDEAAAMPRSEAFGRAVQTGTLGITSTGISVLFVAWIEPALPLPHGVSVIATAALCVVGVVLLSPWLVMILGIWPVFPMRLEVGRVRWRLAHLPAPTPFLTHVAALPWLRTVLLTDALLRRVPAPYLQTLVRFEIGESASSRSGQLKRWSVALPLSILVFIAAEVAGAGDPRKLVGAISLAVAFTLGATWIANRQQAAIMSMDLGGASPQDLAMTLRHLPHSHGQAMPKTSHKPLGSALYDRLFALGHDPGPRPRR